MLTLYYSKGSSALAPHILLHDVGAEFALVDVPISKGAHLEPDFLARNPKGRVPLLETREGGLTENPAILEFIAATHPEAGMIPQGTFAAARARELCAYLCATGHVAFAHKLRGKRWANDEAALADMAAKVPENMADCAAYLEAGLPLEPWALGAQYTYCDPYLYVFARWLDMAGVGLSATPKLAAHTARMQDRASTKAALREQGL